MLAHGIRLKEFRMLLIDSVGRASELEPLWHRQFLYRSWDINFVGHYPKGNRHPAVGANELHHLAEAEAGGRILVAAGRREETFDYLVKVAFGTGEILEGRIIEVEGFHFCWA